MAEQKDYYKILEVEKTATQDDIKKKYRELAKKYHPDKNHGDKEKEEKFKNLSEAYDTLGNEEKRKEYDNPRPQNMFGGGIDVEDILFRQHFGNFGGFGRQQQQRQARGTDVHVKVNLTLQEILAGAKKTITVNRNKCCDSCNGTGAETKGDYVTCTTCNGQGVVTERRQQGNMVFQSQHTCPTCSGGGKQIKNKCKKCNQGTNNVSEEVSVDIPAGAVGGLAMSVNGIGNYPPFSENGVPGNLVIELGEIIDPILKREGLNVVSDIFVSYTDMVLGTELEIKTIEGKAKITIPPFTENGKVLRLKNKGVPNVNSPTQRGDQLVYLNISVPKKLSADEKKALEKLKKVEKHEHQEYQKGLYQKITEYDDLH